MVNILNYLFFNVLEKIQNVEFVSVFMVMFVILCVVGFIKTAFNN